MDLSNHEGYFQWLTEQAETVHTLNPHRSYWTLLRQLHQTPFRWHIHNDGNRAMDAKELRTEYVGDRSSDEQVWADIDASVLEVLIGLSRRLSYEAYGTEATPAEWFWKLLENLDFRHYTDANYDDNVVADVAEALNILLDRTYARDGRGGLFPLRRGRRDQRRIEIWYQMSAYIVEGGEVDNGPRN